MKKNIDDNRFRKESYFML